MVLEPDLTNYLTGTQQEKEFARAVGNTPPGMAFTSGSGPSGETCHKCAFWEHDKLNGYFAVTGLHSGEIKPSICAKYRRLSAGRTGAAVEHWNEACKYFEKNEAPPALHRR